MLAQPSLPESLIKPCIGVMEKMSSSERDLIRIAVEIISELRDLNLYPGDDQVGCNFSSSEMIQSLKHIAATRP